VATAGGISCSKKTFDVHEVVTAEKVVKISAHRVTEKESRRSFDLEAELQNNHATGIVFYLPDIQCFKGEVEGQLSHAFFGANNRTIELQPTETRAYHFVCVMPEAVEATSYKVSFKRVFANPSANEEPKAGGKIIAKDLVLQVDVAGAAAAKPEKAKKKRKKAKREARPPKL